MDEKQTPPPLRLNLGSGQRPLDGFVNVDKYAAANPDVVHDLESFPWPWEDGSVDEVFCCHVMEHLGEDVETYLGIWREVYRVMKHGAVLTVVVPHPRCDDFTNDPTHVRAVTPESLSLFNRALNDQWAEQGAANTPLGKYLGVDFRTLQVQYVPTEAFLQKYQGSEPSLFDELFEQESRFLCNVCKEVRIVLVANKEGGNA